VRHQLIEFGGGAGSACSPAACHRECECECDVPPGAKRPPEKAPRAPRHGRLGTRAGSGSLAAHQHTHTHALSRFLSLSFSFSLCAPLRGCRCCRADGGLHAVDGTGACHACGASAPRGATRCTGFRFRGGQPPRLHGRLVRTLSPHVCAVFTTPPNPRYPPMTLRAEKQKGLRCWQVPTSALMCGPAFEVSGFNCYSYSKT